MQKAGIENRGHGHRLFVEKMQVGHWLLLPTNHTAVHVGEARDDCMWQDFEWHCSYLPKWTDLYHHVQVWLCTCTQASVYLHVCVDSLKGTVQTPHWSCDKHTACCRVSFIQTSLDRIDSNYSEHWCCRLSETRTGARRTNNAYTQKPFIRHFPHIKWYL